MQSIKLHEHVSILILRRMLHKNKTNSTFNASLFLFKPLLEIPAILFLLFDFLI